MVMNVFDQSFASQWAEDSSFSTLHLPELSRGKCEEAFARALCQAHRIRSAALRQLDFSFCPALCPRSCPALPHCPPLDETMRQSEASVLVPIKRGTMAGGRAGVRAAAVDMMHPI